MLNTIDFPRESRSSGFKKTQEKVHHSAAGGKRRRRDVMPLDPKILGFSNTWYRPALDYAEERELEKGLNIRLVTPVYFCASKLEALAGRGKNDFSGSRDMEDLIAVVDGRAEFGERNSSCRQRCAQLPREGNQEIACGPRV
jgi:hypothetical protein